MKRKLINLQDKYRTKKRRAPTNVAEVVELAQVLRQSADAPVNFVPSSEVPAISGGETTPLVAAMNNAKARIAELKSTETMTVRPHEELLEEVKYRLAKEVGVWKETSVKDSNSLINDVRLAKADRVKISVNRNWILSRWEEHVRAL